MPEARHADSGEICSRETYLKRAWCRAEILAFFVRRGPAFMYYLDAPDADLEPMLPSADGSSLPDDFLGTVDVCVEIKILRRVRAESSRRPPRHRRDACSMAWRCRFLAARPNQDGRVIAEK